MNKTYTVPTPTLKNKKPSHRGWAKCLNSLAPRPGLEPGTCGLTESQARGNLFNINVLQQKNQFV